MVLAEGVVKVEYDCDDILRRTHRFFAAFFFAFGRPRFFGAGGVLSIARTASSNVPVMRGTVVSSRLRLGITSCAMQYAVVYVSAV
jgi:hypothetical protein